MNTKNLLVFVILTCLFLAGIMSITSSISHAQLYCSGGQCPPLYTDGTNIGIGQPVLGYLLSLLGATPAIEMQNSASSNKSWRIGVNSNSFVITETGVANQLTIAAGGALTLTSSLTGVLRADSGAVSVDASAGDINKRVTADVTNATATMSNLTALSVTLTSGVHYVGNLQVFGVDSTNADGLQFDLGGGTVTFTDLEFGFAAQPTGSTLGVVTSTTSTTAVTLTVVSTADASYPIAFGFTVNAGGTFIPRFAQAAHSTGTATVRKNSNLVIVQSTN